MQHHRGLLHRLDKDFHFFHRVIQRKRSPHRTRNAEARHHWLGAMVTRTDGYAHLVNERAKVVRMDAVDDKRNQT